MRIRYQIRLSPQQRRDLVEWFFLKHHVAQWCRRRGIIMSMRLAHEAEGDIVLAAVEFPERDHAEMFFARWCR